jgi:protein O-mannosyl-transferase
MKKVRPHARPRTKVETPQHSRIWAALLAALSIAVVAGLAHAPAYSAKALCFDDNQYLLDNVLVKNPSTVAAGRFLGEVLRPSTVRGYYQPLSMISLMVEYHLGGRAADPRVFHAVSLGLHAACSALLVLLLYLLFDHAFAAGLAGLLFAVHPMMVDAVAWISERKTTLAAFFALASLLCYVWHARRGSTTSPAREEPLPGKRARRHSVGISPALVGSFVLYILAVMAKPTAVMLPVALVLLDLWPLRRWGRPASVEKVPFGVVALASSYVTFYSQKNTANLFTPDENTGMKLLTSFHNVAFYPMKLLWPAHLTAHYPYPDPMTLGHPVVLAGLLATLGLLALSIWSWRRAPAVTVGLGIFFVLMAPTMGVVGFNNVPACNKFIYLPLVGLLIPLTKLIVWLWNRDGNRKLVRAALVAVPLVLAACEVTATRQYLSAWRDTETLYRHMLTLAPKATFVREDLARWLSDNGKLDEAIALFRAAMTEREQSHPSQARLAMNLALTLGRRDQTGDLEAAIANARRAESCALAPGARNPATSAQAHR